MTLYNDNRPQQKLEYKFDFVKVLNFRRNNVALAIDTQSILTCNIVLTGIETNGFYITYFNSFLMAEDAGAAGRILNHYDPNLWSQIIINTTNNLAIGDQTSLTVTAGYSAVQLFLNTNESYDLYRHPIWIPEQDFDINFYVQAQQFVPVGALSCDHGFQIGLGFIDKVNLDKLEININSNV